MPTLKSNNLHTQHNHNTTTIIIIIKSERHDNIIV